MAQARAVVSLDDFLRVTIVERDKYSTKEKAAEALGMSFNSFGQRLVKERKRYPAQYADIPQYSSGRVPTADAAANILARLRAEAAEAENAEVAETEESSVEAAPAE